MCASSGSPHLPHSIGSVNLKRRLSICEYSFCSICPAPGSCTRFSLVGSALWLYAPCNHMYCIDIACQWLHDVGQRLRGALSCHKGTSDCLRSPFVGTKVSHKMQAMRNRWMGKMQARTLPLLEGISFRSRAGKINSNFSVVSCWGGWGGTGKGS